MNRPQLPVLDDLSISGACSTQYSFLMFGVLALSELTLFLHRETWHGNWPAGDFLLLVVANILDVIVHEVLRASDGRV